MPLSSVQSPERFVSAELVQRDSRVVPFLFGGRRVRPLSQQDIQQPVEGVAGDPRRLRHGGRLGHRAQRPLVGLDPHLLADELIAVA